MNILIKTLLTVTLFTILTAIIPSSIYAQDELLRGTIIDQRSELPIAYVHIHWALTDEHTFTDAKGQFTLKKPASVHPPFQITYSHIRYGRGYFTFDHQDPENPVIIRLMETTSELSPVNVLAHRELRNPGTELEPEDDVFMSIDSGAFLKDAPNVSGIRRGGFGMDPVIRGAGSSRLNIRVDGLTSTTAACPNRMDPPTAHIRMSEMETVEIHMGPHALEFGPSFGGTVNYITSKPESFTETGLNGSIRTGYETNTGHQKSDLQLRKTSRHWNFGVIAGQSQTEDYTSGSGSRIPGGFTSYDVGLQGGLQLHDEHHVTINWAQSYVRNADFPSLGMDMAIDDTYKFKTGYVWSPADKPAIREIRADAYWNLVDHEMNNHSRPAFMMMDAVALAETQSFGWRVSGEGQAGQSGMTYWKIVANMDRTDASGTRYVDFKMGPNAGNSVTFNLWQDGKLTNTGLYTGLKHLAGAFTFTAGARVDLNMADAEAPAPRYMDMELNSTHLNLSASAGILTKIRQNLEMSLYLGRGVRSPDITERYINYLTIGRDGFEYAGNPALKPEANHQADLLLRYRGEKFQLQGTLFISYRTDYISAVISDDLEPLTAPGVREFQNRGDALFRGFELDVASQFTSSIYAELGASYTRAEYLDDNAPVAEIPPMEFTARVGARLLSNRIRPEISLRHAFSQDRFDSSFGETETPSFTVADILVGASLHERISLSAGIRNLLDESYYEHLNRRFNPMLDNSRSILLEPGRRFYAELSITF